MKQIAGILLFIFALLVLFSVLLLSNTALPWIVRMIGVVGLVSGMCCFVYSASLARVIR